MSKAKKRPAPIYVKVCECGKPEHDGLNWTTGPRCICGGNLTAGQIEDLFRRRSESEAPMTAPLVPQPEKVKP